MKRLTALLLLAAMLAGCANTANSQPTETTVALDEFIDPVTTVSQEDGSIAAFDLGKRSCSKILPWTDEYYALFTTGGEVLKLSRQDLQTIGSRDLGCPFFADDPAIAALDDRLFYFDTERSACVFLDGTLTETAAVPISGEILAGPVISPDFTAVYYCTAEGVRTMDTATGISRLLRQEHEDIVTLEGLLFDGSILHYTRLVNNNQLENCFIRTADGSLTDSGQTQEATLDGQMTTWESSYAAVTRLNLPLSDARQIYIGTLDSQPQTLTFLNSWDDAQLLPGGLLFLQTLTDSGLTLELYDLTNATIFAAATFPRRSETFPYAQVDGDALWLWDDQQVRLYRWDYSADTAEGKTLPDIQTESHTMAQVEEKLLAMQTTYAVPIQIVERHSRTGSGYDWLPGQYWAALELLDEAMGKFPDGFFTAMQDTIDITLVDDFNPDVGVRPGTGSMDIGESLRIEVSICGELQSIFYHELFHAMELHVQSHASGLAMWEDQNPDTLRYSSVEAYEQGLLRSSEFLAEGSNAVVDDYALVSPREDRAQTFMYAMMDGEGPRFRSEIMQNKLHLMCDAIRDAFGWNKVDTPFAWEQYLFS